MTRRDFVYIACQLPEEYGAFRQIQKENYPFNHTFEAYLNAVAQLGLNKGLMIDDLVGFIEDGIYQDKRVSDIPLSPKKSKTITFRMKTYDPVITDYYQQQELVNRHVTLLLIRMTLRLSSVCGMSLSRLTYKVKTLMDTSQHIESIPVKTTISKNKVTDAPKANDTANTIKTAAKKAEQEKKKQEVAQRLESLVKKGDEALKQEEQSITVNANPMLAGFLD